MSNSIELGVIEIQVLDWEKMVSWYQNNLGLIVIAKEDGDRFALLQGKSGSMIGLIGVKKLPAKSQRITLYWSTQDINTSVNTLKAQGIIFSGNIEKRHWGKQIEFQDPEDNLHMLAQEKQ